MSRLGLVKTGKSLFRPTFCWNYFRRVTWLDILATEEPHLDEFMVGERTSNYKECCSHDLPSLLKTTNVPVARRFTCLDSKAMQAVTQEKPGESSRGFSMPGQMCIWSTIPHSILTRNTILRVRDPYFRGMQGSPCVVNSKYVNHTRKMPDSFFFVFAFHLK